MRRRAGLPAHEPQDRARAIGADRLRLPAASHRMRRRAGLQRMSHRTRGRAGCACCQRMSYRRGQTSIASCQPQDARTGPMATDCQLPAGRMRRRAGQGMSYRRGRIRLLPATGPQIACCQPQDAPAWQDCQRMSRRRGQTSIAAASHRTRQRAGQGMSYRRGRIRLLPATGQGKSYRRGQTSIASCQRAGCASCQRMSHKTGHEPQDRA